MLWEYRYHHVQYMYGSFRRSGNSTSPFPSRSASAFPDPAPSNHEHESEYTPTSTSSCHYTTSYSIDQHPNTTNTHNLGHVHSSYSGGTLTAATQASTQARFMKMMDVPGDSKSGSSSGILQGNVKLPGAQGSGSGSTSTGNTKRLLKADAAKPKPLPNLTGSRFQCPKCPKTFSRIENLTRHQANLHPDEDVGKFPCVICKKRFTRSDLLNRHRRIHGPPGQADSKSHSQSLVTNDYVSSSPDQRAFGDLVHRDDRSSASRDGSSSLGTASPAIGYQHMPQQAYQQPIQTVYQHILQPGPELHHQATTQGLTSLMEAALAPQDSIAFTPAENINPTLWDGFMRLGENANMYMGSYDADMSWTLDYLPSENSPSYLYDHDMLTGFEDFAENPYQYQSMQYEQQASAVDDTEDAEGEDEDTTDWPDKIEKPEAPLRFAPRVVPIQNRPFSWQVVVDEARSSGLSAATIRPMHSINDGLRDLLRDTLNADNIRNEFSRREILDSEFPPAEVLDYFLRLYVRYIQPRYPVLHLPTFDIYASPSLMLIAMMFLGSSHSSNDRGRFSRMFHEHLRIACMRKQELEKKWLRNIDNILTYFLLCLAGTWSGSKHSYEFAEGGRGILVTACRRARLLDCRPISRVEIDLYQRPGRPQLEAVWLAWVETEKRKRLGLSIYIFDCQYPALFNNQPYVSKADTTNCVFSCSEDLWKAHNPEAWKMIVGPLGQPPLTYYLHALNSCLLRKWINPSPPIVQVGEFGKTVLMYALHTHIFEWRQSTSMLNPTGLMGLGNSAHDMGNGLRERRKWLVDGLDSFAECYKAPSTSVAAQLLHHLGYVSLDVNLSDMHLVAGRSANQNDGKFAEENLKFWANSEIGHGTMRHVWNMLALCHHCVESGSAADSSYEIAICLFTGGMVCWAFAKLRGGGRVDGMAQHVDQVRKASRALRGMGCWRMCSMFGRILQGFEKESGP
ncbi:uncharacterized protein RCO7_08703 [Rhynchosporium graminicola]|uniref:C2H2-type domain-containing protein n=1 Tax=Rhynchosporium graminicola TaxID=2792576 RepID=A0A1E1LME4_9HELO|nr:uncharacterized protein RCO7_08703 [Rhynchosporium commune]